MASLKFLSLFLLISLCNNIHCQDIARGIRIFTKDTGSNTCKGDNAFQCTAGCDALMVCDGDGTEPILTQKCGTSTPYCEPSGNTAKCQAKPGTTCVHELSYPCTGAGYYPDITDCTKYNLCAGPKNHRAAYQCPAGYVYSSKDVICKRGIACSRITCPANEAIMAPYTPDPQFYYICLPDKEPKVYKCENNLQFVLGVGCQFICPAEGIYQIDEKSYYFCHREGLVLIATEIICPDGFEFDKDNKRCKMTPTTPGPTTPVTPTPETPIPETPAPEP